MATRKKGRPRILDKARPGTYFLPEAMHVALAERAKFWGVSKSAVVREALRAWGVSK
jgi:hypothetical protein